MATRQKVFSSLKDTKYTILQKISKRYDVSDAEIIRTVMERVLGNRKFENTLIHDVFKDLVDNEKESNFDSLISEEVKEDIQNIINNIPNVCPECGEKEDVIGNNVISVNQTTKRWSCSNCFASGGI